MGWCQLDAESIVRRIRESGMDVPSPSLGASIIRGALGFTAVSVAGFVPWAVFKKELYASIGEFGMYVVCLAVFVALSGLLMHRLILGPGSRVRFTKLFTLAFVVYAAAWIASWMKLRGSWGADAAGIIGLLVGTTLMGMILAQAFDAWRVVGPVVAALFFLNTAGYFIGGWVEAALMAQRKTGILGLDSRGTAILAMLSWGVFYGLGFGAGLGLAFHICQIKARALLRSV